MTDNPPQDSNKPLMPRRPAGFDPGAHPHDLRPAEKRIDAIKSARRK